jgi:hypothetical protein
MQRLAGAFLLGLTLQACSLTRGADPEAALFAELFDGPRGSCNELRAELRAEIEALKAAKKKADDDFVAEQEAPAEAKKPPPRPFRKEDPLAALREWTKKAQHAEKLNTALKDRLCRPVDIEAALK